MFRVRPDWAPWIAAGMAVAGVLIGSLALGEYLPGADEPHYLLIVQSLMRRGNFKLQNYHDHFEYPSFGSLDLPAQVARPDDDHSSVDPPVVAAPALAAYAAFDRSGGIAPVIVAAGVPAGLSSRLSWLLTSSAMAAWLGWATPSLRPTPTFGRSISVLFNAAGVVGAVARLSLLLQFELQGTVASASVRRPFAALSGSRSATRQLGIH